jgi:outer membrane protein
MNRTLISTISLIAFGAAALGLSAQVPYVKIITIDMGKLLDNHYKTEEQMAKLRDAEQKAQDELERMVKEGNQLVEQYKETVDQSKNTLLTAEARSKAESDSQKMLDEIQRRQADLQNFRATSQRSLQQRLNNFRSLLLDEISKKVADVAKRKGGTFVVDKSGPSLLGIPAVIYSDPAYDITDEVMAEINKERPAAPAPAVAPASAPAAAPAATPAPAGTTVTPTVNVPGLAPQK